MAATTFRVPLIPLTVSLAGATTSGTYRHLMTVAFRENAEPDDVNTVGLPSSTIRFYTAQWTLLEEKAQQLGWPIDKVFAGFCAAGQRLLADEQARIAKAIAVRPGIDVPFPTDRPEQARYYREALRSLTDKRIAMLEGSTGIGKGRALVAAAAMRAAAGATPIVIAAPTVVLVGSLFREYLSLPDELRDGIVATVLPGATEFIDDIALSRYVTEATGVGSPVEPAVVEWLNSGGASAVPADHPFRHCGRGDITPAWLAEDLRKLAKDLPIEDFLLSNRDDVGDLAIGKARPLLAQFRAAAKDAHIVFCTHAMLALGLRLNWRIMPPPKTLLIDEAHTFEQSVANIFSSKLSLHSLRILVQRARRLGEIAATSEKSLLSSINETMTILANSSLPLEALRLAGSGEFHPVVPAVVPHLSALSKGLRDVLSKNRKKAAEGEDAVASGERKKEMCRASEALLSALQVFSGERRDRVDLALSPDKRFPSLSTGPSSVSWAMESLWSAASEGVVFASATLYVLDRDGNQKCDYMRTVLAADPTRLHTPAPVIARMIYDLPELNCPAAARYAALTPPKITSEERRNGKAASTVAEEEKRWLEGVAGVISQEVAATSKGGTLVLCTSYTQVATLGELLTSAIGAERLVVARAGVRFNILEEEFRAKHREDLRPVLIGLGSAWTGVSLIDREGPAAHDPAHDSLLTDVVVTRLPIGLNRTNVMAAKIERMGTYPIVHEALLVLKQGLGRLIRRDGVNDRRLWVLDARVWQQWNGMEALTGGVRRLLSEYAKRRTF